MTIDRVCKPCNDWLGANVDVLLTDHDLILIKRAQLGVRDSGGNVINPWKDVFRRGVMANDPAQRVELDHDEDSGELVPRVLYKSTRTTLDNGNQLLQITIDASKADEIGKIIERTRQREGLPPLSEKELSDQVAAAKANVRRIDQPEVKYGIDVDVRAYKRAVCKSAYELAWQWLGDDYLEDPVAVNLRDLILKDAKDEIRGSIDLTGDTPALLPWKSEGCAHVGIGQRVAGHLCIAIRIFDVVSGVIDVSDTEDKYRSRGRSLGEGLFVLNDPQTGALRQSTLVEELLRLSSRSRRG